ELLVLDTSPYKTMEDLKNIDVVLRNRDENGYFRSPLKTKIKKIAIKNRIKYHYKDEYLKTIMKQTNTKSSLGITELGRIISASKGSIQGTTLQVPTIGYHTVEETTLIQSIDSILLVLQKLYLEEKNV
ncbi:MAG: peptidase M42, partial [Poseidonibacter sp.]